MQPFRKQLFIGVLLLICVSSFAQQAGYTNFNNYTPLYCSGEIPGAFLMSAKVKYQEDVKQETKTTKKYVSKTKGEFLLQSNYFVDILLQSGKVLFGDSVTNYVNSVADRVLINEPELRAQLTFYTLRSEEPNAFSTDQGMIFVTVGLISQLENEAQLAFILSHEIAHYQKRHTLSVYMEGQRIFSDNTKSRSATLDDKIRNFSNHEKASEYQADSMGLARLSKTGYDCSEAIGAMFVLQFSHLPFDDFAFNSKFYERPMMVFPKSLLLDSIPPIKLDGDSEDDQYSSHPNIANRRSKLEDQLEDLTNCGSSKFASTEAQFYLIRTICRFEVVRLELIARNYPGAIYNSTFLQKEYPQSLYLKRAIGKSLYCMAKYENLGKNNDGTDSYHKVEGNQQQCFYLFQRMSDEQITSVALRYLYDLSKVDSSETILAMRNDLCTDAVFYHNMTMEAMQKSVRTYKEALADTVKPVVDTATKTAEVKKDSSSSPSGYVSKYDKLRNEKKKKEKKEVVEQKNAEVSKFHMLAFGDIIDETGVIRMFEMAESKAEIKTQAKEAKEKKYANMSSYEERKARQKEGKKNNTPTPLGIDTVLVVDPFYLYATEREGYKLLESEAGRYRLCSEVSDVAAAAEMPIVLFQMKEFEKTDIDKYNELALLNEWLEESANHDEVVVIQSETEFASSVCDKYHSDHIMITGVTSIKQHRSNRGGVVLFTILCWPLLPAGIVYALTPEHETYLITGIFNVKSGETEMSRVSRLKAKARSGYIGSQLYDIFTGIKKEPSSTKK